MKRRDVLSAAGAAGLVATLGASPRSALAATPLELKSFRSGGKGFFRAPVLVTGPTEAMLIDGGFNYPDGRAVADAIAETGKTLTTIYISQSDPDYYFSLKPIVELFPEARVIAAPETRAAIDGNVKKKLDVWGPKLGEHGPQTMADITLPEPFDGASLSVDGELIEIVTATRLANRRYLWIPSLEAIVGGVMVFSGTHVWTADTPSPESRAAWVAELNDMLARNPAVVIPGHASADAASGTEAIVYTRDYLLAFEAELAKAADGAALQAAMEGLYPNAEMGVALEIGSKVATGEMSWG